MRRTSATGSTISGRMGAYGRRSVDADADGRQSRRSPHLLPSPLAVNRDPPHYGTFPPYVVDHSYQCHEGDKSMPCRGMRVRVVSSHLWAVALMLLPLLAGCGGDAAKYSGMWKRNLSGEGE